MSELQQHKPFQHQIETIESLDQHFKNNNKKQLVVLPSGAGKTHTMAFHVAKLKPKTFLYIVHRNEILYQTIKIFRNICKLSNRDIGIINQKNKDYDKPYLFCTIQTLSNKKNLEKIRKDIEYMVIDEYHHTAAETYVRVLTKHFNPKYLVGLTATPYRLDKLDIMKFVDGNVANNIDLFEGVERDILVPFHYVGLWDNIDYSEIRWSGYRYNIGDLDRKLIVHKRDEAVLEEYKSRILPENRLTIAFCNSVDHVNRITKKFKKAGIKAVGITYKEKPEVRQDILNDFRNGKYQILFTRDILNEGVDFPECSAIMFLRPTISKTIFFQQLGRGLRKMTGKKNVLVLDYIGNYYRAFQKKNWLKMFKKFGQTTEENTKPYYEYSPDIKVEFEQQVIDMMELQERTMKDYSDISNNEIYDDYMNCCKLAAGNKTFLKKSEYRDSPHRKYNIKRLVYKYGSFKEFLYVHNIPYPEGYGIQKSPVNFYNCSDKKKLIENYHNVKKAWLLKGGVNHSIITRNCPPISVLNDSSISDYAAINYKNNWGGRYTNFLKDIGELRDIGFLRTESIKTKEEKIKILISKLQKKLGRKFLSYIDWNKEYGGLAEQLITKEGGWNNFRKKFGIPSTIILKCKKCNKKFETSTNNKYYCSKDCFIYMKRINESLYRKKQKERKE